MSASIPPISFFLSLCMLAFELLQIVSLEGALCYIIITITITILCEVLENCGVIFCSCCIGTCGKMCDFYAECQLDSQNVAQCICPAFCVEVLRVKSTSNQILRNFNALIDNSS